MKTSSLRLGRIIGYGILLLSVAITIWLVVNRQYVIDQMTVWQYEPDAAVQAVEKRAFLSDKGQFLFYASQPSVDGTQTFNRYCVKPEPQSAILGCYVNRRIYIYQVDDDKLDGIEEVTAAHEMLHAAWDRLGKHERTRISRLLEAEYKKIDDKQLNERMAYYARTEPTEKDNELHSILGTEYDQLSPELERYYDQYFSSRSKLVALHDKYEAVFDAVKEQGDALAAKLASLADSINRQTKEYNTSIQALNSDIASFNERAKRGDFSSRSQFDSERAALLARSQALESIRASINGDIKTYNTIRNKLQSINSQAEALNRSIDSSLAPAPSI